MLLLLVLFGRILVNGRLKGMLNGTRDFSGSILTGGPNDLVEWLSGGRVGLKACRLNGKEFGRGIDEKVGKLLPIAAEIEAKIDAEIDRAIAIVQGDQTVALQSGLKWKIVTSDGAFKKFTKTKKAGVELAKEGDLVLKVA